MSALLDADRRELFRIVQDGFLEAEALAGAGNEDDRVEDYFRIGPKVLCLRFAGTALRPALTRALAHLRTQRPDKPDVTLFVWDSASTGRPLPMLAASLMRLLRITWLEDRGVRGEILDYSSDRCRAALEGYDTDILSLLDLEQGQGIFWTPDWRTLPWYEAGAPLRTLLSWWFEHCGFHMLHGGAVGLVEGGLLLAGRGGSGKSTAALASLASELCYAGDDYCLVAVQQARPPQVYSLYNTAKVKGTADFVRFPWMSGRISNPDRVAEGEEAAAEKPMMFVHEHLPARLIREFPLKAVVLPRYIAELDEPRVIPVAPSSALKALAETTITQLTGSGSAALQAMSLLTRQVPCYLLGMTSDLDRIPPILLDILQRSPERAGGVAAAGI